MKILLHNLQSLSQRVQFCLQLCDDKAEAPRYRGRNEVVLGEKQRKAHKRLTSRGAISYASTSAKSIRRREGEGRGGNICIHISEAQLPKANPNKRRCCPVAGNSGKIRLLGQQERAKHHMTGHVHPCEDHSAVCTASYKIQKNTKQKQKSRPHNSPHVLALWGCAHTPRMQQLASQAVTSILPGSWECASHPGGRTLLSETALKSSSRLGAGKATRRCSAAPKSSGLLQ